MNKLLLAVAAGLLVCVGLHGQKLSLSVNAVDCVDSGTLNLEASCGIARHWTVVAAVKYNPFTFGEGDDVRQHRQRLFSLGARYWPWHVYSGWWLSARMQQQEFNRGGFRSPLTKEGDRFGGGFSAGYSFMLGKHFNLDLGAGLWGGHERYVVYSCPRCGRIEDSGTKSFVLPNDFSLAFSYLF